MFSLKGLDGVKFELAKVHLINPKKSKGLTTTSIEGLLGNAAFSLLARLVTYIAILALMTLFVYMIMKYISAFNDEGDETRATQNTPLWPRKIISFIYNYGTCNKDLESGNCSTSGSSSSSSPSEELYDGKVCVICYDEERNCFFVPCGHCATCFVCAQRIFNGENKVCPVCRRFIGKVRKLFAA